MGLENAAQYYDPRVIRRRFGGTQRSRFRRVPCRDGHVILLANGIGAAGSDQVRRLDGGRRG